MTSVRSVRWLSWALVVLAIAAGVMTLLFALGGAGILPPPPPEPDDFVQRLEAFRLGDQQIFPFVFVQSLATVGVFLIAALLGVVLRSWARPTAVRDAMTLLFVIGGSLGIAANVLNVAVGQAAASGYCDCGFKTEELIAQDYALSLGWATINWLNIAAVTLTGVGVAIAGRILEVTPAVRTLSYLIAVVILLAVALRVLATFVFVQAFDPFQVSDLIIAFAAGILVPIWAILLARGLSAESEVTTAGA